MRKSLDYGFLHFISATFFTLLFLLIFPVLFLSIFLPVYLFRYIVSILKKVLHPDLDKLINTRSSVLAIDSPYKKPCWNLCVWLTLGGTLNFENFKNNFLQNVVLKKLNNGEFADPEYQQYYHKWLGFLFWKWERNFNIDDHMYYYDQGNTDKETTEEELRAIIKRLTWKAFENDKSPWEFIFIPNYVEKSDENEENPNPKQCILILRVHHGFCDGFKILHLLLKEVNNVSLENVAQRSYDYDERNIFAKILESLCFWIKGPYDLMKMLVESNDKNEWHSPHRKLQPPFATAFTKRIPLSYIKDIKNKNHVNFSSVLIAAITGGLRNMMLEKGLDVPEFMTTALAVPMPGHPMKLRNHFIFSFIKLPVGIKNARKRLETVEKYWQQLKKSPVALFNFTLIPVIGALFPEMMKLVSKNVYSTALMSNFPGPADGGDFIGGGGRNKVIDMNFSAGLGEGNVGIGFCMMSFDHQIRIISSADESILKSDAEVELLNEKIMEELSILNMPKDPGPV